MSKSNEWIHVPVQVQHLELISASGRSSNQYKVHAIYTYQFSGIQYQSNQVSFYPVRDNIGNYWPDLYQRLRSDAQYAQVLAWVNPDNPADAVLDRSFRKSILVLGVVLFLGLNFFGFGLVYKSIKKI